MSVLERLPKSSLRQKNCAFFSKISRTKCAIFFLKHAFCRSSALFSEDHCLTHPFLTGCMHEPLVLLVLYLLVITLNLKNVIFYRRCRLKLNSLVWFLNNVMIYYLVNWFTVCYNLSVRDKILKNVRALYQWRAEDTGKIYLLYNQCTHRCEIVSLRWIWLNTCLEVYAWMVYSTVDHSWILYRHVFSHIPDIETVSHLCVHVLYGKIPTNIF